MGAFALWLPVLLSAVFVFIVSSVIHMVLQYHRNDFRGLPDEEGVRKALEPFDLPMGDDALIGRGCSKSPDLLSVVGLQALNSILFKLRTLMRQMFIL